MHPPPASVEVAVARAHVRGSAAADGRLLLSLGLEDDVVHAGRDSSLEPLRGVLTATEVQRAVRLGVAWLKLFPRLRSDWGYLEQLRGTFAGLALVPTGGVTLATASAWLAAGAAAVAFGSELAGREALTVDGLDALCVRAAALCLTRRLPRPS